MYAIERFDVVALPIFNNSFTLSPVPAALQLVPTTSGVFDSDGGTRSRQSFPFPISYKAVVSQDTYNNNRAQLDQLRSYVGARAMLYRRARDDNSVHSCVARLAAEPHEWPYTQRGYFEVSLDFQQLSPWFGHLNGTGWTFDSGVFFDTGRTFDEIAPTTLSATTTNVTIPSNGNLSSTTAIISIVAGSAPLAELTIWNLRTNCYMSWIGTLGIGGTLQIDTGAWSVLNNGLDDYGSFSVVEPFHKNERWMEFASGDNPLVITRLGGGTNSTIAFVFNDYWA